MKTNQLVFALVLAVFTINCVIGQNEQRDSQYYNWFDNQINRYNTSLFNGLEYIELYRTINERHKFFEKSDFQLGSLVYDGQFYDKVPLKYDLNVDELLFNVGYNYPYPTLILFKSKIKSFTLIESNFILINNNDSETEMAGFYEVLMDKKSTMLLKKNKKKRLKRIKGNTVYYEFDSNNSFFISFQNRFYEISSKNDVIRLWPDKREYINEYYNSALRKTNEDNFWTSFFEKLVDTFTTKIEGEKL